MAEKELSAKIAACGDTIRKAKADKVSKTELDPLLAELKELKAAYKETTGQEYVSPGQQNSKRKAEKATAAEPTAVKNGPSKNELKKQAKAAKKSDKKGGAPPSNPASANQPASNAKSTSAALPQLCLISSDDVDIVSHVDAVKCLVAAAASNAPPPTVNAALNSPLPALVTGNSRIALVIPATADQEGSLLFGANSIVRYYNSEDSGAWSADAWLEWEETNLSAAVARVLALVPVLPITSDTNDDANNYLVDFDEYRQIYQYSIMAVEGRSEYSTGTTAGTSLSSLSKDATGAFALLTKSLEYLESGIESGSVGKSLGCVEFTICSTLRYAIEVKKILPVDSPLVGAKTRQLLDAVSKNALFKDAVARASQLEVSQVKTAASPAVAEPPVFKGGIVSYLNECFTIAIAASYPEVPIKAVSVQRSRHFAHYQCNSSMAIFQMTKGSGSKRPSEVADKIVAAVKSHVPSMFEVVESLSVAPQGFINITLSVNFLATGVTNLVLNGPVPLPPSRKRKVAVDFSSPNIAKEMHVGHLRSTIIGDVICRILTFVGHEVNRLNHVGDWGTQFGMLILHLTETFPDFTTSPPNITDLTSFYREAKERFDKDENFKKQAQLTVVKLQSGDATCMQLWKLLCDISRKEFEKVYARLGVVVEERGESFYNDRIPAVVDKLMETGIVTDDGSKSRCIFLNDIAFGCCGAGSTASATVKRQVVNYPLFLRKSDGGYGYDSTDMTAIHHRLFEMDVDWVVYVTDKRQAEHFYMCFEAARRAKWLRDDTHRFEHVGFGMVCGDDGKPYKTRSGDTVRLVDLLDMSVVRMEQSLKERQAEGKSQLNDEEIKEASRNIGYGAVKYFDLKQHPESDYAFSYDKMLDTKGNTAVYLMFAYARFASIVRKGRDLGVDASELASKGRTFQRKAKLEKEEVALALELLQLPDTIEVVLGDMFPHRICEYLYELCTVGTTFVTQCFVLNKDDREVMESRLLLCNATCTVMKKCFDLLGITPLERI